MDHVLQVVRVEGLLHAAGVAGVIGFDVVGHSGPHGSYILSKGLFFLSKGCKIEAQKQT